MESYREKSMIVEREILMKRLLMKNLLTQGEF